MADGLHTREQGLRVHHLANLGGLVAIAGLDREPPDLLIGGLLELAARLPDLPATRRASIASAGRVKLDARATSKRAWKAWSRSKDLHGLTLSSQQASTFGESSARWAATSRAIPLNFRE
jgi:hypothetical protein